MVKLENLMYVRADSTSQVVIKAKSGESHRLEEIFIDSPASESYFDVVIGAVTVARIPVKMGDCLFVAPYSGSLYNNSILKLVRDIYGADVYFEADQDEDITLNFNAAQGTVHVFYSVNPPGIDKTKLGRSKSPNTILFHIVTHSATVNASKNYSLDTPLIAIGFPDIKDGYVVPSGRSIILKALAFASAANAGTNPTYLHIYDGTYEFFDPYTHKGISVEPGKNVLVADIRSWDVFRVEDYEVLTGHKLTLTFNATYDGTNSIAANTLKLILIGLWVVAK